MKRVLVGFFFCALILFSCGKQKEEVLATQDLVPDKETAVKIAEIIWFPIFGNGVLKEKPYLAELKNDSVWLVRGQKKKFLIGGVAYIEINKKDCRILKVSHGK